MKTRRQSIVRAVWHSLTSRIHLAILFTVPTVFYSVLLALGNSAHAQAIINSGGIVPDRPTLNSIVAGYGPVTENFEAISLPLNVGQVGPPVLNSTTHFDGWGPGLVVPGVTFWAVLGDLQWNGAGYYGQPSEDILSTSSTIQINFSNPTLAFGLDLLVFAGFGDHANVNVYGADDTTLLASVSGISISDPSSTVFFGYQDSAGIGMVQIEDTDHGWSPLIDNVTFATVPEPSAFAILIMCAGMLFVKRQTKF
jgi:hypothetical protein